MGRTLADVLAFARIQQIPSLARRAMGIPWLRPSDFFPAVDASDQAKLAAIARRIRGEEYPPAIFVHGIMPRSGTNYLSDIIALHPDVCLNPGRLYEFPLLYMCESTRLLQQEFAFMFPRNAEVMSKYEMLAHLASGWLASLQQENPGRRLLFKDPHLHGIGLFPFIFPGDKLFLLIRDGRDLVSSSLATFGAKGFLGKGFRTLVREWKDTTDAALAMAQRAAEHPNAALVRYEDIVRNPAEHIRHLLSHAGLDERRFDIGGLRSLSVRGSSETAAAGAHWKPVARSAEFSPIGRWANWTTRQKNIFKSIAGETLVKAGYEDSLSW
jgi:protein-tyrosine sulfotransferase